MMSYTVLYHFLRRSADIIRKTIKRGGGWFLRRTFEELQNPTMPLSVHVNRWLVVLWTALPRRRSQPGNILYFFYDLKVLPITFDVVSYLIDAELARRKGGYHGIHLVIVPSGEQGNVKAEAEDYEAVVPRHSREWRVHNILVQAAALLPSCTGHSYCSSRRQAERLCQLAGPARHPHRYSTLFPTLPSLAEPFIAARNGVPVLPALTASRQALAYVDSALVSLAQRRKVVTITLRQYDYMPQRNSNQGAWIKFADELVERGFVPVFILDTDKAHFVDVVKGHAVYLPASWNVHLRMALYERSFINLAIATGPMELCWYNERCRYILFYILNSAPQANEQAARNHGFEIGHSPAFATPFQKWVWAPDVLETIREEFDAMSQNLLKEERGE